jgi:hypothetical protein
MRFTDSRESFGPGILVLQDPNYEERGEALPNRRCILGVRVRGIQGGSEQIGHYEYDQGGEYQIGDVVGSVFWPKDTRDIPGISWAWGAVVGGGGSGGGGGSTDGGSGSTGGLISWTDPSIPGTVPGPPIGTGSSFPGFQDPSIPGTVPGPNLGTGSSFPGFTPAPNAPDANAGTYGFVPVGGGSSSGGTSGDGAPGNPGNPDGSGGGGGPLGGDPVASGGGNRGSCGVMSGDLGGPIQPLGQGYVADTRYKALSIDPPLIDGEYVWPKFGAGTVGIVVAASDSEKGQKELFFPIEHRLAAIHRKADPKMGSIVADGQSNNRLSTDRIARLQSMMWVIGKPLGAENAIAWNIGPTGCGDTRGGFVIDDGEEQEPGPQFGPPVASGADGGESGGAGQGGPGSTVASEPASGDSKVIALVSKNNGGPFDVGSGKCRHHLGGDEDGRPIVSLHITTSALFRRNDSEDGPIDFEGVYPKPGDNPQQVKAHISWDGDTQKWRLWAEAAVTTTPTDYPVPTPTRVPTGWYPQVYIPSPGDGTVRIPRSGIGSYPNYNPPWSVPPLSFQETIAQLNNQSLDQAPTSGGQPPPVPTGNPGPGAGGGSGSGGSGGNGSSAPSGGNAGAPTQPPGGPPYNDPWKPIQNPPPPPKKKKPTPPPRPPRRSRRPGTGGVIWDGGTTVGMQSTDVSGPVTSVASTGGGMLASSGSVAQAQNFQAGKSDSRFNTVANPDSGGAMASLAADSGQTQNPVSGIMSAFGAQGGQYSLGDGYGNTNVGGSGDPWNYTVSPGDECRWGAFGTVNGGWIFHPPETGPEDVDKYGMSPPNTPRSKTYVLVAGGARFGAGLPEFANGQILDGYSWTNDESTGDLNFYSHSGGEDGGVLSVRFTRTGQDIAFRSGTSYWGTLAHAISSDRTWTLPDVTAYIPGMLFGTGSPGSSAPEGTFYWDTSGNALYVNNDGGTSWTLISSGGGSVTGSGTSGQVTYWTGSSTISGEAGLTYDAANDQLTILGTGAGSNYRIKVAYDASNWIGFRATSSGQAEATLNGSAWTTYFSLNGLGQYDLLNSSTGSGAGMRLLLQTGVGAGGDLYLGYAISGGRVYSHGIDNDDGDAFVLSQSIPVGSTNLWRVTDTDQRWYGYNVGGESAFSFRAVTGGGSASSVTLAMVLPNGDTGDVKFRYELTGTKDWSHGLDNSDSDAWVLAESSALGSSNRIRVDGTATRLYGEAWIRAGTGFDGKIAHAITADRTWTFPDVTGTVPLGTGSTDRVALWSGTNTLSSDAGLTYNSTTDVLTVSGGILISGLTSSRLLSTDASKNLASVSDLTSWVAGTANRVTVSDDGDGTITLSGPQDIHTGASPTFTGLTLSGLTNTRVLYAGSGGVISNDAGMTYDASTDTLTLAGDLWWQSGTAFLGKFAHAITAERTWTFPDTTGTVALTSDLLTVEEGDSAVVTNARSIDFLAADFDVTAASTEANIALASLLNSTARTAVRKNTGGVDVGSRRRLNFIEGANITLTITDDSGAEEVDIQIDGTTTPGTGEFSATRMYKFQQFA